jgi:hypothetical protein
MKPLGVAVTLLAAVLLAGCGGSSATSTGTPTPTSNPKSSSATLDACVLVTAAQASAIVGTDLTKSETAPVAGVTSTCAFSSTGGASFIVGAGRIPNVTKVAGLQHSMIKAVSGEQAVTGLGDQAGESKDQYGVKIAFFKGDVFVFLDALSPTVSADAMAPKLESLGRTIAGQL